MLARLRHPNYFAHWASSSLRSPRTKPIPAEEAWLLERSWHTYGGGCASLWRLQSRSSPFDPCYNVSRGRRNRRKAVGLRTCRSDHRGSNSH